MTDLAILILRLGLGIMFMAHGAQKAFGMFGGPGIPGFSQFLESLKILPAVPLAYMAASVELLGGLCLILGFYTKIAAALLLVLIATAALKVHAGKGFFLQAGGFEYTFIIACVCLALIMSGAGRYGIIKNL
ncbi:MAG: DoxX family protein [Candidatus Omnitrophica bacterium]|nr:DoxX family protein [Candidatus Omnitrophota bacterium]MDD5552887.1 DoxX family protein [Candidatus Omnitrophota bacterium]